MPAEAAALVRTWRVGKRKVIMTAPRLRNGQVSMATIEWLPTMPRKLSRREWRKYRAGRDKAFAELCGDLGVRGVLCEL